MPLPSPRTRLDGFGIVAVAALSLAFGQGVAAIRFLPVLLPGKALLPAMLAGILLPPLLLMARPLDGSSLPALRPLVEGVLLLRYGVGPEHQACQRALYASGLL